MVKMPEAPLEPRWPTPEEEELNEVWVAYEEARAECRRLFDRLLELGYDFDRGCVVRHPPVWED